jgi:hypothetical protein
MLLAKPKMSPAMAAGVAKSFWSLKDLLLDSNRVIDSGYESKGAFL